MLNRSLDPIFRSSSIAVIGASRRPGSIGSEILRKLLEEMLLRLSHLIAGLPEIEQVAVNPFIAGSGQDDSSAVDARISLLSS